MIMSVQMSSCTYECLDIYKDAVDSTCDSVDSGIKVPCISITLCLSPCPPIDNI